MRIKPLIFSLLCLTASTTLAQRYVEGEKYKAGIKAGLAWTTLHGDALNSKGKIGFHTGLYYRQQLGTGLKSHLLAEGNVAFRGAQYNYGIDRLDRINLVMIDVPVMYMRTLKREEDNAFSILFGAAASAIVQTEGYVQDEIVPRSLDLPFNWFNAAAISGVHWDTYYAGFQIAVKYNFRNILVPNGVFEKDIKPNPIRGGSLRPLSIEFAVYF